MNTTIRPFHDLRDTGLLWLINASLLHPRGYAIALCFEGDTCIGWQLMGDGSEPWSFGDATDTEFQTVSELLSPENRGA